MDLPTLDLRLFTHGPDLEKKKLAKALVESFRAHGFAKLTNHGIPEATVSEYMQAVRELHPLFGILANHLVPGG